MKSLAVVGRDWRFRALLRAQLREEGWDALGFETLDAALQEITRSAPAPVAVVFDTAGASAIEVQRLPELRGRLPVLVLADAGETLPAAGLRVLRRPVSVRELAAAVKKLAEEPH